MFFQSISFEMSKSLIPPHAFIHLFAKLFVVLIFDHCFVSFGFPFSQTGIYMITCRSMEAIVRVLILKQEVCQ